MSIDHVTAPGPDEGSGPWPDWEWHFGDLADLRTIGRYAVEDAIAATGLRNQRSFLDGGLPAAREVAAAGYNTFKSHAIAYGLEPLLYPDGDPDVHRQRIRTPEQIRTDKGTCIDLAVAYAAQCYEANLRAAVVFAMKRDAGGGYPVHALVLVDLRVPRQDLMYDQEVRQMHEYLRPMTQKAPGLAWISAGALPEELVLVDIIAATRGAARSFVDACSDGESLLLQPDLELLAIDLFESRAAGNAYAPFAWVPSLKRAPAINTRLPIGGRYDEFDSRGAVTESLKRASGRVVLVGDSASGKSTLAHRRALAADHGYGWFLTGTDRKTLINSLAQAELAERPLHEAGSVFDADSIARAGLQRLRDTTAPWVVVVDNADCDPKDLASWLPEPGPGQTLIITTTEDRWTGVTRDRLANEPTIRPQWARGAEVTGLSIGPVSPVDLKKGREWSEEVERAVGGSPLVAQLVNAAIDAGACSVPQDGETAHAFGWRVVQHALDDQEAESAAEARQVASLLAWLPAEDTTPATLRNLGIADPERALKALDASMVIYAPRGVIARMHRLVREAVRLAPAGPQSDPVGTILRQSAADTLSIGHHNAMLMADDGLLRDMESHLADRPAGADRGLAVYGLGRVVEYRGASSVKRAAGIYSLALRDEQHLSPRVRSACLLGRARWHNHDDSLNSADAIGEGERLTLAAMACVADSTDPLDVLAHERARAMQGLLRRKLANSTMRDDPPARRRALEAAVEILQESNRRRIDVLTAHPELNFDDLDRGLFNLGGTYLTLAQVSDQDLRAGLLSKSLDAYRDVLDIRQQRYGSDRNVPHVAACLNGIMMVRYYEVVLDALINEATSTDNTQEERQALKHTALREATEWGNRTLAMREAYEGRLDGGDTRKTTAVMAKIMMARIALAAARVGTSRTAWEANVKDFSKETQNYGFLVPDCLHLERYG